MDKLKMQSENLVDANVEKIAKLFPNCVTEAKEDGKLIKKVDFDLLRQELSSVLVEGKDERYRLDWAGKRQAILTANSPIAKTLRPCREESVGKNGNEGEFDSENLYIEGDNLEVLKLMHETYLNKIDVIYIDPPYNTGKNLIYKNNFHQSVDDYLESSGQIDEEKKLFVVNPTTSGRYHSDWLSMMYSRLKLARDLLSDSGLIVVTIDDYEIDNTLKIMNEIFGEENCLGVASVRNNPKGRMTKRKLSQVHEYVIFFGKTQEAVIKKLPVAPEDKSHNYIKDQDGKYYVKVNLRKQGVDSEAIKTDGTMRERYFPIYFDPITKKISATEKLQVEILPIDDAGNKRIWRRDKEGVNQLFKDGDLFCTNIKGAFQLHFKFRGGLDGEMPKSIWYDNQFSASEYGTSVINELLGREIFSFPKSLPAVIYTLKCCSDQKNITILDFFSGSATTAHAVMQLNAEDGGNRKFIMVQLPEKTDENSGNVKSDYINICEIGKERIRRAGKSIFVKKLLLNKYGKSIPNLKDRDMPKLNDFSEEEKSNLSLDIGFRVLKLSDSNMKDVYYNPKQYNQSMLLGLDSSIKEDRSAEDILFQVMLDKGVSLSSKIEKKTTANGKQTFYIVGETGFGIIDLICCLDKQVNTDAVKEIAKLQPECCVFLDSGIENDATRTNIQQIFTTYSPKTKVEVI